MTLTARKAAEYSNIGINKIDSMLHSPNCPFVLFVGTKKLVKRRKFEEYIIRRLVIRAALQNYKIPLERKLPICYNYYIAVGSFLYAGKQLETGKALKGKECSKNICRAACTI